MSPGLPVWAETASLKQYGLILSHANVHVVSDTMFEYRFKSMGLVAGFVGFEGAKVKRACARPNLAYCLVCL